jgi:uncharacterized membrane protein YphA (DoxX/SURF4 family)
VIPASRLPLRDASDKIRAMNDLPGSDNTRSVRLFEGIFFLLRIAIGWHFLYEGIVKLITPGWTSAGYLEVSRWIFADFFHWLAADPVTLKVVDFLNIWGLISIGLFLMLGFLTRIAAVAGTLLLGLYYVCNPPFIGLSFGLPTEGNYLVVDKNLVEMLALLLLAAFPAAKLPGLDAVLRRRSRSRPETQAPAAVASEAAIPADGSVPELGRRELVYSLASLPFLGAFGYALTRRKQWASYEEKNLIDAVTSASTKTLNIASLSELKRPMPVGLIQGVPFSRIILGGNLLSGWAHSRDLIYVSQLVKAYHHKEKIFATLLLAEKCGINTLLTNPILCTLIDEYWKRNIGKIKFISDCAGLNYENGISAIPYGEYLDRIRRAIDYGASACYIQGETADYYIQAGEVDKIARALDLIRENKVICGIGAHKLETIRGCVEAGLEPHFWMKTLHHLNYWSARHPEWHDNKYCDNPQDTLEYMKTLAQPWIAFKVLAAGAIHPKDGFRYAFENGADFVCAGMYDFQMVEDANIATDILTDMLEKARDRVS